MKSKENKMIKLNLGCEDKILKDFVNVDVTKHHGVNKVYNLNKFPLPWKDSSVDFILCSHLLEHLDNPLKFMLELHRICRHGAIIDLRVPHFSCSATYADLTHKKPGFSYLTFGEPWANKSLYKKFKVKKRLNFTRVNFRFLNFFINPIINLFPIFYERFFCYLLPCSEIKFKLEVAKHSF